MQTRLRRAYPYADFGHFPLVTNDGGRVWTHPAVPIPQGYGAAFVVVGQAGFTGKDSAALPVTMFFGNPVGGIRYTTYRTNDGGADWWHTRVLTGTGDHFFGAYFLNAVDGWVSEYGVSYRTTDGGGHWLKLASRSGGGASGEFVTPLDGFRLDWGRSGRRYGIYETVDGGVTWKFVNARFVGAGRSQGGVHDDLARG